MKHNKKRYTAYILSLLFITLMIDFSSQAQGLELTFFTTYNGDLWEINVQDNLSIQLTTSGYNYGLVLSPDGQKVAYSSIAPEAIDVMNSEEYSTYTASNIYLMDVATRQVRLIADQDSNSDSAYMRGVPFWSPDSIRLLWTEIEYDSESSDSTLQLYDLNSATTSFFAEAHNVIGDAGMIGFVPMKWGRGGIAMLNTTYVDGTTAILPQFYNSELDWTDYSGMVDRLEIYNPDTGVITNYDFYLDPEGFDRFWSFEWVTYQGRGMIALQGARRWELLDPLDGSRQPLDFPPRLRNEFSSDSLELFFIGDVNTAYEIVWQIADGQGIYDADYSTRWLPPAISSDGTMIALPEGDSIWIWQNGSIQTIQLGDSTPVNYENYLKPRGITSIVWGISNWFIDEIISVDCSDSLPTRLIIGMGARVLPGDANNVRSDVGEGVIGQIPAGDQMQVTGESKCDSQGIRYYPISFYNGEIWIDGWTAEGLGDEYWLEPIALG